MFKFCCKSIISQPLPNFQTQFSPKDEFGSYDNIALTSLVSRDVCKIKTTS